METSETLQYIDIVYRTLKTWYQKFAEMTPRLIVGLLVFCFFFFFSKFLSKIAVKIFQKSFLESKAQNSVATLIGIFRFLIVLMGAFISLEIMQFSGFLWKFIGSLGVAGVIAGVALKDLVSSIFSGMLVGIDKAFKVGDYITIGSHSGTVQDIGFLTTKLITDDGKKVYIPNQVIFSSPFYNVTDSPQRRVIFELDLPADQDIVLAREVIFNVIKNLDKADRIDEAEVNISNVQQGVYTLTVKFWVQHGVPFLKVKSHALLEIKKSFDSAKILLSTPTTISIESPSKNSDEA